MKLASPPRNQAWKVFLCAASLATLFGLPKAGYAQGRLGSPVPTPPQNPPIKLPPIPPGVPTTEDNFFWPTEKEVREGRDGAVQVEKELKVLAAGSYYERLQRLSRPVVEAFQRPEIIAEYRRVHHIQTADDHSKRVPFEWTFKVLDDKKMINAFTLPGGRIYVSTGLMDEASDDELAAVLGHECTHAAFHHSIFMEKKERKAQMASIAGLFLGVLAASAGGGAIANAAPALMMGASLVSTAAMTGFSRDLEAEADRVGVMAIRTTQYNPVAMLTFMEKLETDERLRGNPDYGIYATHPYSNERVGSIQGELRSMGFRVDSASKRQASGTFRVKVVRSRVNDRDVADLMLDGNLMFRVAAPEDDLPPYERAERIAERMERAFSRNLTDSDIGTSSNSVNVGGVTVIRVLPDDADVAGGMAKAVNRAYLAILRVFQSESLHQAK